ncbi:hypothetical protein WSK_4264 [Novosphingobium sp. Rr 2-17]|uniref:glycosyltransferase family 1 protein n=1 Tax=Novosphingobium sp. Rr 2-17 TaxID=555793 RepID=UPI000269ABDC|nr:glycosyltransferase family 1 protein [Novosphingobium sp. Rr 2-17]EIZ77173.1 hypothetical protein WSK_4264 [Novosphingobium sp. Rr 2-17]
MSRTFWFSPVSPARTDIARYSERVVPNLARLLDLKVVPTGFSSADSVSAPRWPTVQEINASHTCFYNIGNNPLFHGEILRVAMRHPGIVVLHDLSLQDLCHSVLGTDAGGGGACAGGYQAAMSRWYGRAGSEAGRAALVGDITVSQLSRDFPLFEVALQGALGAVTHNPDVTARIAERFPGMPVITLHLPYDCSTPPARAVPRLGPDRTIRLAMFGYLNPNRRLCDFLRAWAQSPWRKRFELDLAGEMNNGPEVRAVLAETGLGGQVRDHGFVTDARLDEMIGQAHMVLNLRNPTMGEASGSQLRIWANGAASVVSDTGWYAQLPQGSVLRVGTESEHEDLLALLDELAQGRIDLAEVARRGRQCVGACDPAPYAASLSQWLDREREPMFSRWAETASIETVARAYALCTPRRFVPKLPERLLS